MRARAGWLAVVVPIATLVALFWFATWDAQPGGGCTRGVVAPSADPREVRAAISDGEDFRYYPDIFIAAARRLVNSGRCTVAQLRSESGFMYSPNRTAEHPGEYVYFLHCGSTNADRWYLGIARTPHGKRRRWRLFQ